MKPWVWLIQISTSSLVVSYHRYTYFLGFASLTIIVFIFINLSWLNSCWEQKLWVGMKKRVIAWKQLYMRKCWGSNTSKEERESLCQCVEPQTEADDGVYSRMWNFKCVEAEKKKNLNMPVLYVLKRTRVGRAKEERSNVSFDSRVHLWPRESAWCKISPVKAEVAPLEHNYKNNDCFQTCFPKNLPIFLRIRYVCNTSKTLCVYTSKWEENQWILNGTARTHPFFEAFQACSDRVRNMI